MTYYPYIFNRFFVNIIQKRITFSCANITILFETKNNNCEKNYNITEKKKIWPEIARKNRSSVPNHLVIVGVQTKADFPPYIQRLERNPDSKKTSQNYGYRPGCLNGLELFHHYLQDLLHNPNNGNCTEW